MWTLSKQPIFLNTKTKMRRREAETLEEVVEAVEVEAETEVAAVEEAEETMITLMLQEAKVEVAEAEEEVMDIPEVVEITKMMMVASGKMNKEKLYQSKRHQRGSSSKK